MTRIEDVVTMEKKNRFLNNLNIAAIGVIAGAYMSLFFVHYNFSSKTILMFVIACCVNIGMTYLAAYLMTKFENRKCLK